MRRSRSGVRGGRVLARAALGVVLAVVLAGCGGDDPVRATEPASSGAPATTSDGSPSPAERAQRRGGKATTDAEPDSAGALVDQLRKKAERIAPKQRIPARTGAVLGADISWPQCPKGLGIPQKRTLGAPLPVAEAEYVVVGLTNGPGFVRNPCLAEQAAYVRDRGLMAAAYAVASYPDAATVAEHSRTGPFDGSERLGALRNTGYQQARYNVASMREADLRSPIVWIDVEPVPDFGWSTDQVANAAVVEGVARGYRDAGYAIGVYSTPYLWTEIVGGFRLGVPEWRAAGQTSADEALARCGADWVIQGGEAVLGQWVQDNRDMNLTCPGVSADLGRWFHQY